ncbi:hypothetical protein GCM10027168_40330 [Streptomyces capparidis]
MLEELRAWGDVGVVGPLGGGARNEVVEVWRGGERLVARRSRRAAAALEWELDLLAFLGRHGFRVPEVVPAADGRRHVGGVVVQRWLEGVPPRDRDWPDVAAELRRLHALTRGRPQRPGFCSTRELLRRDRGGDVDLSAMPDAAVDACRRAWRGLGGVPTAVVHGDPCAGNVRVSAAGVGLLDWDEARVDHVDLDLADLPCPALPPHRLAAARAAVHAWEAANGWLLEPEYARRRLAMLTAPPGTG